MVPLRCALAATVVLASVMPTGADAGQCDFQNEPVVGYFWDPACRMGKLGCNADGRNVQCRFCGVGHYANVSCPPSSCQFANEPWLSYYWDTNCRMGGLGCWADGIHAQCRFCGNYPYTSISCPEQVAPPNGASCAFDNEPVTPYYWEAECVMGKHGCNADGRNLHCRFCGRDDYWDIPCPAEQFCQFANKPTVPYFWDSKCKEGLLGCKADGIHQECRFCAVRPFEDVACPDEVAPPKNECTWPLRGEPLIPYFWDTTCQMGMLGCWADGLHAECRFCGSGAYSQVACPNASSTPRPDFAQPVSLQQAPAVVPTRPAHVSISAGDMAQAKLEQLAARNAQGRLDKNSEVEGHRDKKPEGEEEPISEAHSLPCLALPFLVLAGLAHL